MRTPREILVEALREIAKQSLRVDSVSVDWLSVTTVSGPESLIPDIQVRLSATRGPFDIPSEGWK